MLATLAYKQDFSQILREYPTYIMYTQGQPPFLWLLLGPMILPVTYISIINNWHMNHNRQDSTGFHVIGTVSPAFSSQRGPLMDISSYWLHRMLFAGMFAKILQMESEIDCKWRQLIGTRNVMPAKQLLQLPKKKLFTFQRVRRDK